MKRLLVLLLALGLLTGCGAVAPAASAPADSAAGSDAQTEQETPYIPETEVAQTRSEEEQKLWAEFCPRLSGTWDMAEDGSGTVLAISGSSTAAISQPEEGMYFEYTWSLAEGGEADVICVLVMHEKGASGTFDLRVLELGEDYMVLQTEDNQYLVFWRRYI